MTPDRGPITAALVAYLAGATGKQVGQGTAPLNAVVPYAVVYPLPGGDTWGPVLYGPDEGAQLPYQVTSVGLRTDQAEWLADKVRQAMVGRTNGQLTPMPAVAGLAWLDRELGAYGGLDREGEVVSVAESYVVHVVRT